MIYPIAVISIAMLVVYIILWKVIPVFGALFTSLGAELPLPTRVVVALSKFVGRFWWLIVGLVVAGVIALRRYYATEQGRLVIDSLLLKAPILGSVLRKIAVARFCRTLGTLLSAGVPVLESLDITARTSGNAVIERAILDKTHSLSQRQTRPIIHRARLPPHVRLPRIAPRFPAPARLLFAPKRAANLRPARPDVHVPQCRSHSPRATKTARPRRRGR